MKKNKLIFGLVLMLFGLTNMSFGQITQTFNYTGGKQTFVVPSCVSQVTITCYGAQGGNGHDSLIVSSGKLSPGGTGGLGAIVSGVYPVTAGSVLNFFVGGAAINSTVGYNGGGVAGENAGAGGGASDVRLNDTTLASRIIVAAGGGGGGNGAHTTNTTYSLKGGNGGGGGANGSAGPNTVAGFGGFGGVASTGGVNGAGCSCCMGATGQNGSTGIGGKGGDGTTIYSGLVKTSGGGGGGGMIGGGGGGGGTAGTINCTLNDTGGGGGGAGGTNYVNPSFTSTTTTNGAAPAGNGKIVISYTVNPPPVSSFTINNNSQCLNGNNFNFTNTSTGATSSVWYFGDGTTSTTDSPSHSYTSNGLFTVKLVASSASGCKDSTTLTLNVRPQAVVGFSINNNDQCLTGNSFTFTNSTTGASSYYWSFGDGNTSITPSPNYTYTSANNYSVKLVSTTDYQCKDSITKSVTVRDNSTSSTTHTACDSYSWNGMTYTTSGDKVYHTSNALGCDSAATLHLTINHSNTGIDVKTACDSYTWIDGVTYTTSNNTATHTLQNSSNCDSVVTLNLTINHSNTGTDVKTACDSYTWIDGVTYTTSNNTATHTLQNSSNCDSVVTLNLTINHSTSGTDVKTACDSYTWIDGVTYTSSNNTATHILQNSSNCDSVVTLNLTINTVSLGVTLNGTTITANTSGLIYQWLDCNNNYAELNGQHSQSFTASSNGSFAAKITEGQCTDTTTCTVIATVGISENASNTHSINVYPNPVFNQLMITAINSKEVIKYEIANALGQVVLSGSFNEKTVVETSNFAPGVYVIKLKNANSIEFKKIVKE